PGTGRTAPSSASSPMDITEPSDSAGRSPFAARIESAAGRSSPLPAFGRSAGARFTTTFLPGSGNPTKRSADRMRSRLSFTAASGRPTMVRPGRPAPTAVSTTTARPSRPTRAAEYARATVTASGAYQRPELPLRQLLRRQARGHLLDAPVVAQMLKSRRGRFVDERGDVRVHLQGRGAARGRHRALDRARDGLGLLGAGRQEQDAPRL